MPVNRGPERGFAPIVEMAILVVIASALVAAVTLVQQKQIFRGRAFLPDEGGGVTEEVTPPPPPEPPPPPPPPEETTTPPPAETTPPPQPGCGPDNPELCVVPPQPTPPPVPAEENECATADDCAPQEGCTVGCTGLPRKCRYNCPSPPPPPAPPPPLPPPQQPLPEAAFCGDGVCNGGESCSTCPGDCGPCPTPPQAQGGACGPGDCDSGGFSCEQDGGTCKGTKPDCSCKYGVPPAPVPPPTPPPPPPPTPPPAPATIATTPPPPQPAIQASIPYGGTTVGYGTAGPSGNYPSRADITLNKELEPISNAGLLVSGAGLGGAGLTYAAPIAGPVIADAATGLYVYTSNVLPSIPTWAQIGLTGGAMALTAIQCSQQGYQDSSCAAGMTGFQANQLQEAAAAARGFRETGEIPSSEALADVALRWRTKLEASGVEVSPLSIKGGLMLSNFREEGYALPPQILKGKVETVAGGANPITGEIVVGIPPVGREAEFASRELATTTHELSHRTRILSGSNFYGTNAEAYIEEAKAISDELRFTRMLGIRLPEDFKAFKTTLANDLLTGASNLIGQGASPRNYNLFLRLTSGYPNITAPIR